MGEKFPRMAVNPIERRFETESRSHNGMDGLVNDDDDAVYAVANQRMRRITARKNKRGA
jgi:hypothetical protein